MSVVLQQPLIPFAHIFDVATGDCLVAAAWLHDVGYALVAAGDRLSSGRRRIIRAPGRF
jgi:hypothetical protein